MCTHNLFVNLSSKETKEPILIIQLNQIILRYQRHHVASKYIVYLSDARENAYNGALEDLAKITGRPRHCALKSRIAFQRASSTRTHLLPRPKEITAQYESKAFQFCWFIQIFCSLSLNIKKLYVSIKAIPVN